MEGTHEDHPSPAALVRCHGWSPGHEGLPGAALLRAERWSLCCCWDLALSAAKARVGALRPVSPADPAAPQQAVCAGRGLGEEEQEAAAATPEEHGSSRRGAGAAADPL